MHGTKYLLSFTTQEVLFLTEMPGLHYWYKMENKLQNKENKQ